MPLWFGGSNPHWRMVGVDGLRCLANNPSAANLPPQFLCLWSIPAHVKDGAVRRFMKPFLAVPTLELPKDRAGLLSSVPLA